MEGGVCFHCQKPGHWARYCPYKSPIVKPPLPDSPDVPLIQCPCGAGTCVIRISRTPKNPGRKFYSCPARKGEACDFFKWCDVVTDHGIRRSPQALSSPPPMCPCGAGISTVSREVTGPNADRRFFICPVKKGQGACNFFQWEDAQVNTKVKGIDEMKQWSTQQSAGISQQDNKTEKSCSLKEGALRFQHLESLEDSPVKKNSCPSSPETVLGTFEGSKTEKSCSLKEEAMSFQHLESLEDSPVKKDSCPSSPETVLGTFEGSKTEKSCSQKEEALSFQHLESLEDSPVKKNSCPSSPETVLGTFEESKTEKSCSLKEGALSFQHLESLEDSPVKKISCPSSPKTVLGTFEGSKTEKSCLLKEEALRFQHLESLEDSPVKKDSCPSSPESVLGTFEESKTEKSCSLKEEALSFQHLESLEDSPMKKNYRPSSPETVLGTFEGSKTEKSCSLKEEALSFQHLESLGDSPVKKNSCPSSPESVLGILEESKTEKSCSLKEGALSFRHLESLEDSPVKKNSFPSSPESVLGTLEESNLLLIENGEHDDESELCSMKVRKGADGTSLEDLVHQILHLNVLGWLGQLAFPPSRCLTSPPPKPFFCCVFPSYDPISVPLDVKSDVECPSDLLWFPPGQNTGILDGLLEPSGFKNSSNILSSNAVIFGSILEAFQQAALHVQSELLTLLELMDPLDHESMVREANSAFSGLERLGIDYRPFYERVKKFIGCASTLARIESAISTDHTSQKLIDSYSRKMSNYENLSRVHTRAMAIFTSSDNQRQSLQKETTRIKEMLLQIETQLSCTELETAVLEVYLLQISQEMSESKQQLEAVCQEASQAIRFQQQREAEKSSAKAALERARDELQQLRALVSQV